MILLLVDLQKEIVTSDLYKYDTLVSRIQSLIHAARKSHTEIIYIQHDDGPGESLTKGNLGFEIFDAFQPEHYDLIIQKHYNSAFRDTTLLEYLRQKEELDIMIAGLQTDYCMDATIKAGFEHGFHMIVPDGTNSTYDNRYLTKQQSYEYYNSFIWNHRYAECISFEQALTYGPFSQN